MSMEARAMLGGQSEGEAPAWETPEALAREHFKDTRHSSDAAAKWALRDFATGARARDAQTARILRAALDSADPFTEAWALLARLEGDHG